MAHGLSSCSTTAPECTGFGRCSVQAWLLHSMRHLSSLTRDGTHIPCTGRWILSHWTTREVSGRRILRQRGRRKSGDLGCQDSKPRALVQINNSVNQDLLGTFRGSGAGLHHFSSFSWCLWDAGRATQCSMRGSIRTSTTDAGASP